MPKTACFTRTDTLRFCQNYQLIWGMWVYRFGNVLEVRESSEGDLGVVAIETRVTNQHGEGVTTFRRKMLVPKKKGVGGLHEQ